MVKKKKEKQWQKVTDTCVICGRTNRDINKFINHHVRYATQNCSEITIRVCHGCHERLHGRRTFNNYFEKIYGKDLGPYVFACRVREAYENAWENKLMLLAAVKARAGADKLKKEWGLA